jgi:hypothetical protein
MARPIFKLSFGGERGRWININLNLSLENEKSYPKKEQDLHPVRNDAPLLCGGVWSQNNSGGVWCPAGISNGVHPFLFLEIIFKIFHNELWSKTHIFNILFKGKIQFTLLLNDTLFYDYTAFVY